MRFSNMKTRSRSWLSTATRPLKRPEHRGNRVNIDSGAGFGRALTAIAIEGREVFVLEEDGRQPLRP